MKRIGWALMLIGVVLAGCAPQTQPQAAYYDSKLGYRFTIPSTWPTGRYGVQPLPAGELARLQPLASGGEQFIYLPSDRRYSPQPLFTLFLYSRENWERARTDPGPFNPAVVQPGNIVFAIILPQSNPYDPTSDDGKTYTNMVLTAAQIQQAIKAR